MKGNNLRDLAKQCTLSSFMLCGSNGLNACVRTIDGNAKKYEHSYCLVHSRACMLCYIQVQHESGRWG